MHQPDRRGLPSLRCRLSWPLSPSRYSRPAARLQLLQNLGQVLRVGLEIASMRPLEVCLQGASDPPIGVAEVIVDRGVFRLELNRPLKLLHGFLVIAEPEVRPPKRIDDVAVIRALRDGAL